jgi:hypothetical protein
MGKYYPFNIMMKSKRKYFQIYFLISFFFNRIVNDLINQSQNGKYGDTSGIGQLIDQV